MYNVLQDTATHCNTLQLTRQQGPRRRICITHCNTLQHIATNYTTLQHTATQTTPKSSLLQARQCDSRTWVTHETVMHTECHRERDSGQESERDIYSSREHNMCFVFQRHTMTLLCTVHCNTLQHTATHCNTLHHTATYRNTLLHTAYVR